MVTVVKLKTVNSPTISPLSSDETSLRRLQQTLQAHLNDSEKLHIWLETNLDEKLNFSRHLLVLTSQRLISLSWPALYFVEYPLVSGWIEAAGSCGRRCIELVFRRHASGLLALHHGA